MPINIKIYNQIDIIINSGLASTKTVCTAGGGINNVNTLKKCNRYDYCYYFILFNVNIIVIVRIKFVNQPINCMSDPNSSGIV